jgi:Leucine-rich repeat (LRR) protein
MTTLNISEDNVELFLYTIPKNTKRLFYDIYSKKLELTSPPELPEGLIKLDCSYHRFNILTKLPQTLEELYCYYCRLTTLPDLPENLKELSCSNNEITILPDLPP